MSRIQIKKNEKGFTLIEILVVVAILAIISVITMVSINKTKKNVSDKSLMQDFNELKVGLDQYKATCKMYPVTLTEHEDSGLGGTGDCSKELGEIMSHFNDIPLVQFSYYPLARSSSPGYCNGYWLGVSLDPANGQLTHSTNITPNEMQTILQNNSGVTGGWIRCNNSNAILPINANANVQTFYGQTSSGVY